MIVLKNISLEDLKNSKVIIENTNVFASYEWINSLSDIEIIGIFKGKGEMMGYFVYHVFSKSKFKIALTPPLTPFIPIYYQLDSLNSSNKLSEEKEILTEISNYFKTQKYAALSLNLPPWIIDAHAFIWNKFNVTPRHSYEINLLQTEDEIFNQFSPERRKCIRKAEKENLTFKIETDLIGTDYYNLLFKSRGLTVKENFFKKLFLANNLKANTIVFTAFDNKKLVACKWFCYNKNRIYYLGGWYSDDSKNKCPDPYLMWQTIKWSKNNSIAIFDFEGSMQPDIEKYFRDFGGVMISYNNITKQSKLFKVALALSGKKFS